MRDKDNGYAAVVAEAPEEVEDLCLNRYLQSSRWLLSNQQLRIAGQCHGNHHRLLLSPQKVDAEMSQCATPPWRVSTSFNNSIVRLKAFDLLPADAK